VADKPAVGDLVSKLSPLLKSLEPRVKKIFLSPLTRYWIRPCCMAQGHLTNYSAASYLPNLGVGVYSLREYIRDSLYVQIASNFRVICPNRMLNIRPGLYNEEGKEAASLWARTLFTHQLPPIAALQSNWKRSWSLMLSSQNPPKEPTGTQPETLSLTRQPWVDGCSAALPRGDVQPAVPHRGAHRGAAHSLTRGNRGGRGKYRPYPQHWRKRSNKSGSSQGSRKNN
jgi:hypothetical protein